MNVQQLHRIVVCGKQGFLHSNLQTSICFNWILCNRQTHPWLKSSIAEYKVYYNLIINTTFLLGSQSSVREHNMTKKKNQPYTYCGCCVFRKVCGSCSENNNSARDWGHCLRVNESWTLWLQTKREGPFSTEQTVETFYYPHHRCFRYLSEVGTASSIVWDIGLQVMLTHTSLYGKSQSNSSWYRVPEPKKLENSQVWGFTDNI